MTTASEFEYRMHYQTGPRRLVEGKIAYFLPSWMLAKRHEIALTISLITNRPLFGRVYWGLQPDYFDRMPPDSGVFLRPLVPTSSIVPGARRPGDIDLLVIPYEGKELILDRVMAIEIKVLRGRFARQGKSPNDFGGSQVRSLKNLNFPYVSLIHLIISDESPRENWREIGIARVIDRQGRVEILPSKAVDWMPIDLMQRSFGRLEAAIPTDSGIGLVAAYLGSRDEHITGRGRSNSLWLPIVRRADRNPELDRKLLNRIADVFFADANCFLDTPRYDPIA